MFTSDEDDGSWDDNSRAGADSSSDNYPLVIRRYEDYPPLTDYSDDSENWFAHSRQMMEEFNGFVADSNSTYSDDEEEEAKAKQEENKEKIYGESQGEVSMEISVEDGNRGNSDENEAEEREEGEPCPKVRKYNPVGDVYSDYVATSISEQKKIAKEFAKTSEEDDGNNVVESSTDAVKTVKDGSEGKENFSDSMSSGIYKKKDAFKNSKDVEKRVLLSVFNEPSSSTSNRDGYKLCMPTHSGLHADMKNKISQSVADSSIDVVAATSSNKILVLSIFSYIIFFKFNFKYFNFGIFCFFFAVTIQKT